MAMRKLLSFFLLVILSLSLTQTSCISKLWKKKPKEPKEKVLDVLGNVESIDPEKIVVRTKGGSETFILGPASIKGGDYDPGDLVHVYYKVRDEGKVITMVVEKIK